MGNISIGNITTSIYRTQANDSVMCGLLYWIYQFYAIMQKLVRSYQFIFPYKYEKHDKKILEYF